MGDENKESNNNVSVNNNKNDHDDRPPPNEQDGLFHDTKEPGSDEMKTPIIPKILFGLFLFGLLLFVIIDSFTGRYVEKVIYEFIVWVEENPGLGVFSFIIVYMVGTIIFIPGALLTIGAGFAFGRAFEDTAQGVAVASISVFIGALLGSVFSFLLGRYLFRDFALNMAREYPVFRAMDRAMEGNGLKIMILLRLSPIIPYNALDYLSGLTSIPLWKYTVALFALLPGIAVLSFLGATASSISETKGNNTAETVTLVLGILFAILGVVLASYYSKIELDQILEEEEEGRQGLTPTNAGLREEKPSEAMPEPTPQTGGATGPIV